MPRILKTLINVLLVFSISQHVVIYAARVTPDTSKVYRGIEQASNRSKLTRFIYRMVFRPVVSTSYKRNHRKTLLLPYDDTEGKIIRNINIVTLDPFGYSLNDTAVMQKKIVFKMGNTLHIKTQYITIKNILLFRENDHFDLMLVKESERLIRSLSYVREVVFFFFPVQKAVDSVDVYIRVMDKWSIIPYGNPFSVRRSVGLIENNFIGFGHEFQNKYSWNRANADKVFTSNYLIPNIRNTHVSTVLHSTIDEKGYFNRSIAIERPFFSPHARWAAGLNFAQLFEKDTLTNTIQGSMRQNYKCNIQDYWTGHASQIFKIDVDDEHITNAIVALRYSRIRYPEKPDEAHDVQHVYANEDLYLSGIGISTRKYLKDSYIFNFGVIEDVPVGKAYGITGGYQIRNNIGRLYLGARISFGDYIELGNLSCTLEYGTFFHGPLTQQGVFSASSRYFSNLLEIGNWKIRQFIKPQVTLGIDRFSYDSLTINDENGIRGFSSSLHGTKKIVLTQQIQSYAPWNLLGFRFGPYLICSLGMLGTAPSGFKKSPLYSQIGIGTLIRNDYLVFNNIQLSVSYYPSIPGDGYDIFKFNSFLTTDFGFRDFIYGKPEIAAFQ